VGVAMVLLIGHAESRADRRIGRARVARSLMVGPAPGVPPFRAFISARPPFAPTTIAPPWAGGAFSIHLDGHAAASSAVLAIMPFALADPLGRHRTVRFGSVRWPRHSRSCWSARDCRRRRRPGSHWPPTMARASEAAGHRAHVRHAALGMVGAGLACRPTVGQISNRSA